VIGRGEQAGIVLRPRAPFLVPISRELMTTSLG
jgi:hypothetical protein